MDRRWGRMALGAIALLALLALPAGAGAKAKKKKVKPPPPVVTATATAGTSTDGQIVSPSAVCPTGTVALGGGFSGEVGLEEGTPTDLYVVHESRRDSPTSWHVEAARDDTGAKGNTISITVTVYCQSPNLGRAKKPKKRKKRRTAKTRKKQKQQTLLISEVSSTGPEAARYAQSSATASCPAGLSAISGGYSLSPPPILSMNLKFPLVWANHSTSAQGWTASETTSGSTPLTLTTYVYCANTSAPLSLTGSGSVNGDLTGSATTPPCPANRPLISGGFDNTPVSAGGTAELAIESTGSGGGWRTSAYNLHAGAPASLQAIAYCR
jgi:hypothetical protein